MLCLILKISFSGASYFLHVVNPLGHSYALRNLLFAVCRADFGFSLHDLTFEPRDPSVKICSSSCRTSGWSVQTALQAVEPRVRPFKSALRAFEPRVRPFNLILFAYYFLVLSPYSRICGAMRKPGLGVRPRKTFARALGGSAKFSPVPRASAFSNRESNI